MMMTKREMMMKTIPKRKILTGAVMDKKRRMMKKFHLKDLDDQ